MKHSVLLRGMVVRTFEVSRWFVLIFLFATCAAAFAQQRWTEAQANNWYAKQPWPVGADFLPSTAINELEMWQADTFDEKTIDRELGWAEAAGMNTMRVFLHNLLWEQDANGFQQRMDRFLTIAADPTFAEAHTQLAIAYERQGRADEARAERAKASEAGKTQ